MFRLLLGLGSLFLTARASAQASRPSISITRPLNGEVRPPGDIQLECEAVPSDFAVRMVEYRTNGGYFGRAMQAPFSMLWPAVGPGRYVLEARVFDLKGAFQNSEPVQLLVGSTVGVKLTAGPYLQSGSSTSIVVRWQTDWFTDTVVHWGATANSLDHALTNDALVVEHEVMISGLAEGSRWFYSVGSTATNLARGPDYLFHTAPRAARPVRFWVIGDSGTADLNAAMVRNAYYELGGAENTDFWLMLGDNVYFDGFECDHRRAVFQMYPHLLRNAVVWPAMGNHDAGDVQPGITTYFRRAFTLPQGGEAGGVASGSELYYSFDYANLHLVCLDSYTTDRSTNGPMLNWLRQDLAATEKDWIIAYWHHPPYSWGSHDSDLEPEQIEMRQNAVPILEDYGVDLVLSGHSHDYERSYLLSGHYGSSATLVPAMLVDSGLGGPGSGGPYRKPFGGLGAQQGTVYAVCGCSGQGGVDSVRRHPAMALALGGFGSMIVDVDGLTLRARFLRPEVTFDDEFVIDKSGPTTLAPRLEVYRERGLKFSWPTSLPPFELERRPHLSGAIWEPVVLPSAREGRRRVLELSPLEEQGYFRLRASSSTAVER
jgi:hypothetical protein